jgi:polar amino acid transport system substrate-binding protein
LGNRHYTDICHTDELKTLNCQCRFSHFRRQRHTAVVRALLAYRLLDARLIRILATDDIWGNISVPNRSPAVARRDLLANRKRDTMINDIRLNRRTAFRLLSASALAALVGLIASGGSRAEGLADIKVRGYMTAATEDDFRPFEFVEDGVSKGYDNDVLAEVKKSLPFEVKQEILPWSGILPGVTTGKYDVAVTAVLVTAARKPTFDFSSPVAQSTSFYAIKTGSPISSPSDLNDKTVGAQAGSAMLADLQAFDADLKAKGGTGIKKIVEYPSYPEAYQDLAIGRTDAVVNTEINLRSLVEERKGTFVLGQAIAKPVYIAWALKKGNTDTVKLIDDALLEMRNTGKMYELQQKWFGTSFKDMPASVN